MQLAPKTEIPRIATIDQESYERFTLLFDGITQTTRFSCLTSPTPENWHIHTKQILEALYHVGATLINSGQAYNKAPPVIQNDRLVAIANDAACQSQTLLQYYNHIKPVLHDFLGRTARSPYFPLFVIKVALDHMPEEFILQMWKTLKSPDPAKVEFSQQTIFPNGCSFIDNSAAYVILAAYIVCNPARFLTQNFDFSLASIPSTDIKRIIGTDATEYLKYVLQLYTQLRLDLKEVQKPKGTPISLEKLSEVSQPLVDYKNRKKALFFDSHTNNTRANETALKIITKRTVEEVDTLLEQEIDFFEWIGKQSPEQNNVHLAPTEMDYIKSLQKNHKKKEDSGYYRALVEVDKKLNAYRPNPNVELTPFTNGK